MVYHDQCKKNKKNLTLITHIHESHLVTFLVKNAHKSLHEVVHR